MYLITTDPWQVINRGCKNYMEKKTEEIETHQIIVKKSVMPSFQNDELATIRR